MTHTPEPTEIQAAARVTELITQVSGFRPHPGWTDGQRHAAYDQLAVLAVHLAFHACQAAGLTTDPDEHDQDSDVCAVEPGTAPSGRTAQGKAVTAGAAVLRK